MKIIYIHNHDQFVKGHAYKYYSFLQGIYGGTILNGNYHNAKSIELRKPDLIFVRGDSIKSYKIPLELKIPYIFIENDVYSMRMGRYYEFEKERVENAVGVIFTSEDHLKYYQRMGFKLPPCEVIHLRPLKKDLDFIPKEKINGKNLVYAGGLTSWKKRKEYFGYRSYHKIFKAFIDAGWNVHLYSTNSKVLHEYEAIGCVIHKPVLHEKLFKELSQYTAGLQAYNKEDVPKFSYLYTQTCRPNKLWDYLAAGIPTIGYNPGNGRKVYEGKWGIVVNDLSVNNLKNIDKQLPVISEEMRYSQAIDNDLVKFDKLIKLAMGANK